MAWGSPAPREPAFTQASDTAQPDPPGPTRTWGGCSPGHPQGAPRSMGSPRHAVWDLHLHGFAFAAHWGASALEDRPQPGPGQGAQGQSSGGEGHGDPSSCTPTMESSSSRACRPGRRQCLRPADRWLTPRVRVLFGAWRLQIRGSRGGHTWAARTLPGAPGALPLGRWRIQPPPYTPSPGVSLMPTRVSLATRGASAGLLQ